MKSSKRNFLKNIFLCLSILSFSKLNIFISNNNKLKLKKNKNYVWYLNSND